MNDDDIRARLNLDHIKRAAAWAAERFRIENVAHVKLTPGDGTVYQVIVVRCAVWNGREDDEPTWPRDYTVTLVGSFGDTYQWAGQALHSDYVGGKWSRDGNKWTAVVMTEFLNAFSEARSVGVR